MASSSSLVCKPRSRFSVFLSFRGEDTRNGFVSHLYKSLKESGIDTFRDDEKLERGESIKPKLFEAIEESKISIIVLSANYAFSSWCLEELSKILECKERFGQKVVPIFYNIDPSDVKNQKGSFEEAFSKHEKDPKHQTEKVKIWKDALSKVGRISGYDSRGSDESSLIEGIVNYIFLEVLDNLNEPSDLVGMDPVMEKIHELLKLSSNNVSILGIWGMSGIGKTTIAEVVYKRIHHQFEAYCFLSKVKDTCHNGDFKLLQKELLSRMTKRGDVPLEIKLDGKQAIKVALSHKKNLVVLDDVNDLSQLEALFDNHDSFGPGSRIIIITRDKHLLEQLPVDVIYEVQGLQHDDAFQLFTHYAFKKKENTLGFWYLSRQLVGYCKGLPLALKVLGSHMAGKNEPEWEDEIRKLQRIPNPKIHNVLKLSFEGLDGYEEKELFLEIACFFNGWDKTLATKILDSYGLFPISGIRALVDRSLVTIVKELEVIRMHDLLREMGKQIVREESINDPGRRSRLFDYKDIYDVFTKDKATDKVKGISLYLDRCNRGLKEIHLSSKGFTRMTNLRFLKITSGQRYAYSSSFPRERKLLHCKDLECLPSSLEYLHWDEFPLSSLPSNFDPGNLVILEMAFSPIERLWEGTKCLENLIILKLCFCQNLKTIPNLSRACKLEKLILWGCSELVKIEGSLEDLNNLHEVDLKGCEKLEDVPKLPGSLITLILSNCDKITKCPEVSGNTPCLTDLMLDGTSLVELPSTIENLQKLENLDLTDCLSLESVSSKICKLKSLIVLYLCCCPRFAIFPDILEPMPSLGRLDLSGTGIKDLPSSIARLEGLKSLNLSDCKNLEGVRESQSCGNDSQSLPGSQSNAQSNVKLIKGPAPTFNQLPSSSFSNLRHLFFDGSNKLGVFRFLERFTPFLRQLFRLRINDCHLDSIPDEIGDLCNLEELEMNGNDFESLPETIKRLPKLGELHVKRCKRLYSLPGLPSSLRVLNAQSCASLERLTTLPKCEVYLNGSRKLREQHIEEVIRASILEYYRAFTTQVESNRAFTTQVESNFPLLSQVITYSGSEIPEWIVERSEGSSLSIRLPANVLWSPQFACVLCVVIGTDELFHNPFHASFFCYCDVTVAETHSQFNPSFIFTHGVFIKESDEVAVSFATRKNPRRLQFDCNLVTVSFNFRLSLGLPRKVRRCGVCILNGWSEFSHEANPRKRKMPPGANEPNKRGRPGKNQEEEEELPVSELSKTFEKNLKIKS